MDLIFQLEFRIAILRYSNGESKEMKSVEQVDHSKSQMIEWNAENHWQFVTYRSFSNFCFSFHLKIQDRQCTVKLVRWTSTYSSFWGCLWSWWNFWHSFYVYTFFLSLYRSVHFRYWNSVKSWLCDLCSDDVTLSNENLKRLLKFVFFPEIERLFQP